MSRTPRSAGNRVVLGVLAALGIVIACALIMSVAYAQVTPVQSVPILGTQVELGGVITLIILAVAAIIVSVLGILGSWVLVKLRNKLGLDENKAWLDIEARNREALHSAATHGAALVANEIAEKFKGTKIDVGNPAIALGVNYIIKHAPDALKFFKLDDPNKIASLLVPNVIEAQAYIAPTPIVAPFPAAPTQPAGTLAGSDRSPLSGNRG